MHQSGGLEAIARVFVAEMKAGNAAEFGVDEGSELIERLFVAAAPGFEEFRDVLTLCQR
jgi:hypothetical protein